MTGAPRRNGSCYAALDLGTNNCRLLIATPASRGFRIVEAFSRIVRLGEGLSRTGQLSETAMQRTLSALSVCADKIARRGVTKVRAVATQAYLAKPAISSDTYVVVSGCTGRHHGSSMALISITLSAGISQESRQ